MKRILSVILTAAVLASSLVGCSGVSQEEYDALLDRCSQLEADNQALNDKNNALQSENNALEHENNIANIGYNNLYRNYNSLEAKWRDIVESPEYRQFIALSQDEKAAEAARAEKERIEAEEAARLAQEEADRLEAERKAQEEAERQAAEEARLAEEAKGYETGITFEQLSRTPDNYVNAKVKFTGSVLQVLENSGVNEIRMSTAGKYDDVIYGSYLSDILDIRILEDDVVTIYGEFKGLITYETIMGGSVTLPYVLIDRIELS